MSDPLDDETVRLLVKLSNTLMTVGTWTKRQHRLLVSRSIFRVPITATWCKDGKNAYDFVLSGPGWRVRFKTGHALYSTDRSHLLVIPTTYGYDNYRNEREVMATVLEGSKAKFGKMMFSLYLFEGQLSELV